MRLVEIDMTEVRALADRFADSGPVMSYELRAAGVGIVETGRRMAIDRAPVVTGFLRNSIGVTTFNADYPDFEIEIAAQAEYARYVEEGTRYFGGRFYMRDAAAELAPVAQQRIDLAVKRAAEKLAGG